MVINPVKFRGWLAEDFAMSVRIVRVAVRVTTGGGVRGLWFGGVDVSAAKRRLRG